MLALDIKHGLRSLRQHPLLAAIAVVTLALGIGATTTIFSVVHAVLLTPLPYPNPEQLVRVYATKPDQGIDRSGLSGADFVDFREQLTQDGPFTHLGAYRWFGLALTDAERPRELATILATPGLIAELGTPLLGRTFLEEEGTPGSGNVVLMSYGLWQNQFGGDEAIINSTLLLDGEEYTVVGVMPERFSFPAPEIELWAPWTFDPSGLSRGNHYWNVIARLEPGVAPEAAESELRGLASALEAQYPDTNEGWSAFVVPLQEVVVGAARPALVALLLAVVLVLLIACANVANLLLARAVSRQQEIALRAALGAGRARLVRQLLTESVMLALVGGLLGVGLAYAGVATLVRLAPDGLPRIEEIGIDLPVLLFALTTTLLSGIAFGILPALRVSAQELAGRLREGGRGADGQLGGLRVRSAITVAQIALSLVLLVGAGLLLRSFARLIDVDAGFRPERRLALQLFVYNDRYDDPENQRQFFERLDEELEALPGVRSAAGISTLPLSPIGGGRSTVHVVGRAEAESEMAAYRIATAGYFETMGTRLLAGRVFTGEDRADSAPVMVLNQTAARRFFPAGDAIGSFIKGGDDETVEVIGIVADVRHQGLDQEPTAEIFFAFQQNVTGTMSVVVETEGDPEGLIRAVQDRVWVVDPAQPIWQTTTLETLVEQDTAEERFQTLLVGLFAGTALVLAAIGLYGVLSYSVVQRTREIGLRMAIGASTGRILSMILRNGSLLVGIGLACGIGLAFAFATLFSRLLAPLLFQTSAADPPTFGGVVVLMACVALLACLVPALRASRVDPIRALHHE